MHDIRDLEDLGVVAVAIASSEFRQAADEQNRSLGYDPAVIFVPHPSQDGPTTKCTRSPTTRSNRF